MRVHNYFFLYRYSAYSRLVDSSTLHRPSTCEISDRSTERINTISCKHLHCVDLQQSLGFCRAGDGTVEEGMRAHGTCCSHMLAHAASTCMCVTLEIAGETSRLATAPYGYRHA